MALNGINLPLGRIQYIIIIIIILKKFCGFDDFFFVAYLQNLQLYVYCVILKFQTKGMLP